MKLFVGTDGLKYDPNRVYTAADEVEEEEEENRRRIVLAKTVD